MATHVGRYIRDCRRQDGLSLRELAARVGLSDVFLSAVERGKKRLDESHWEVIAAALGSLDVDELRVRAELDQTMPLELADGADAGLALSLARRMTSTPLTDELTNSLIALLSRRG